MTGYWQKNDSGISGSRLFWLAVLSFLGQRATWICYKIILYPPGFVFWMPKCFFRPKGENNHDYLNQERTREQNTSEFNCGSGNSGFDGKIQTYNASPSDLLHHNSLKKWLYLVMCVYVCVCPCVSVWVCRGACTILHIWRSDTDLRQSVLSFPHMGSEDQTQIVSLSSQVPLPIELCCQPHFFLFL